MFILELIIKPFGNPFDIKRLPGSIGDIEY